MESLTAPLAKELIDHIDVYESEGKGKNKTQRIVIYYRFVGYIELPDKNTIVNDTRQGVAVNYISGTLPETAYRKKPQKNCDKLQNSYQSVFKQKRMRVQIPYEHASWCG